MSSLAAQVSGFVQMISKRNDMILTDIYIDIVSGENTDRSEFTRMLTDVERKKFDVIITKSINRV